MDLQQIPAALAKEDAAAVVPLTQPDGTPDLASDGTRATLSMVGMYAAVYREREAAFQAARRDATDELTRDEVEREMIAWSVADWHGIEDGGTPLPCTLENVRTVFTAAPWVYDRARIAFNQRGRFFADASAA